MFGWRRVRPERDTLLLYQEVWEAGEKLAEDRLKLERSRWEREEVERRKWADLKRRNEI